MMLECYFDDSADGKGERYCASGGLIGSTGQWDSFIVLWSPISKTLKAPFRSTECECGHEQFKDWEKNDRDKLMASLVSCVQQAKLMGFASIVSVGGYRKAFPDCAESDAYMLTIPHTIMNMAFIADGLGMDVNVWFENGPKNGTILKVFESIKAMDWKPARRLRAIAFDSKELYPLQAADLVAREAFKIVDNWGTKPIRIPVRRMWDSLSFHVWKDEGLLRLAEQGGPSNLELLAAWDGLPDAPQFVRYGKIGQP
jgi:hypothetical protein